jgi:hypothetical protein
MITIIRRTFEDEARRSDAVLVAALRASAE